MDVVAGEVGQGPAPDVLELDSAGSPGTGRLIGVTASQGLERGVLIGTDHVLVGPECPALDVGERRWPTRSGPIPQPFGPLEGGAATPLADRVEAGKSGGTG